MKLTLTHALASVLGFIGLAGIHYAFVLAVRSLV